MLLTWAKCDCVEASAISGDSFNYGIERKKRGDALILLGVYQLQVEFICVLLQFLRL